MPECLGNAPQRRLLWLSKPRNFVEQVVAVHSRAGLEQLRRAGSDAFAEDWKAVSSFEHEHDRRAELTQ